jgi:GT2 family glycosyltransferase
VGTEASSDRPVSIVLPTHNRVTTLAVVATSYLTQDAVCEVIVVDDASEDGTEAFGRDLARRHGNVRYLRNPSRLGVAATRNRGVEASHGRFVLFGEDDLRLGPGYAARLLSCLEKTGAGIVAGRILFPFPGESDEETMARVDRPVGDRLDRKQLTFNAQAPAKEAMEVPLIHAISLNRREVFETVQFDPGFKGNAYREETDFYLRARRAGNRIFFCPHAICVHLPREVKKLGGSMAQGIWVYKYWSLRNNWRFLKRHYPYLRDEGIVDAGIARLMISFAWAEAIKIPSFYLRKFAPRLYSALARRAGKNES